MWLKNLNKPRPRATPWPGRSNGSAHPRSLARQLGSVTGVPVTLHIGGDPSSSDCAKPLILNTDDWSVVRDQPDHRAVRPTDMLALTPTGHGFLWAGQNSARNVLLTGSGNGTGTTTVKGG
ncbi:hypothetical protein ACFU8W_50455 [Streptomyces sp. NPDC057565]|uniref:hypothetical protein n=1 Tax=Streptomyces sp. NPDC057565 TaxID=3346169 RepID=UPI0036C69A19